ncbi:putative ATP-dependent helicase DinG [Planctomycetes bacterium Pla163]|uniref:Putative ATP-dependent helicase DinG n=1 Tax=Rohdeia mirabilis TaxID=2528008 RepID=A0A518D3Q8_9BACT|nr:putative ATP-dependent helicase DinG [Planctomycetes bacterium Pla163]
MDAADRTGDPTADPAAEPLRTARPRLGHVLFARVAAASRVEGAQGRPRALEVLTGPQGGAAVRTLYGPDDWGELEGATVVVPRRDTFELWLDQCRLLGAAPPIPGAVMGLDELAGWLAPGGSGSDLEQLLTRATGSAGGPLDASGPAALERATRALVREIHGLAAGDLACLGRAWEEAGSRLAITDPAAAHRLVHLARLVDRPSLWAGASESVFGGMDGLEDGRIAGARSDFGDLDMALAEARPGWAYETARREDEPASMPPDRDGVEPLADADLERVDQAFAEILPQIGGGRAARGATLDVRPAQLDVARSIARSLGTRTHLLLHAPTGTGKTLAYLIPGLLFAVRNGLRVGFATYTKALQRQAYDRDLPVALAALERLGVERPRVTVLKGRANYVCWRALVSLAPGPADGAARHLAWCHLLGFALTSEDGDLDRLPRNGLDLFGAVDGLEREWELLRRSIGAKSGCCTRPHDRSSCGADAARKRAERSHGVVTNHAFALARPEFFRHLVFDECEHLHDQAHAAFSRTITFERARRMLDELGGNSGRGVLNALARAVSGALAFGATQVELDRSRAARTRARTALGQLERGARAFIEWRQEREADRSASDDHALLREFVEAGIDAGDASVELLLVGHNGLCRALHELSTGLGALSEGLFEVRIPRRERVRFRLDEARTEVEELSDAIAPWLPLRDGEPRFDRNTFYDVVERPNGDLALETRVLLPHEYLGRFHYPRLAGAVFLSATTLLRGGFEDARRYLGLERAAEPAEDEEREPEKVVAHAAPEAFDYSRVLMLAPSDVPDYRGDKAGWLDHGARLIAHVAMRTKGRVLALYTNQSDLEAVARRLHPHLAPRGIEVLAQNTGGQSAERLADRFRTHGSAVLLGVDSFWFGADFAGTALEYLFLAKLPYGVPDRYHQAQCAAMGRGEQRRTIYMPRALARFRQGFGRLMRRVDDSGCVFVLDKRLVEPRHRSFLRELPMAVDGVRGARFVRASTDRCLDAAFEHMGIDAAAEPFERTRL